MSFFTRRGWSILLQTVTGASCSVFLFLSSFAQAIVDTNDNGVSDLWEKQFNSGNLFNNFDPAADPDGDGWSNGIEAISGTDPRDGNPPTGCVRPLITHFPAVYGTNANGDPEIVTCEAVTITWPTLVGKQYTLLYSYDLSPGSWIPIDDAEPRIGDGAAMANGIPLTQPDGSAPPGLFLRVAIGDVDNDEDGLADHEEILLGSSASNPDSDGDGMSDSDEAAAGTNPNNRDTDGDSKDDGDDADPNEILVDWTAVPESYFALVEVDAPSDAGLATDLNDKGQVLFTKGLWSGGTWSAQPEIVEEREVSPPDWDVETYGHAYSYEVTSTNWTHFAPDDKIVGEPAMTVIYGQGSVAHNVPLIALKSATSPPNTSTQSMEWDDDEGPRILDLLGVDSQSRIFARKSSFLYYPIHQLWILDANLQKTGEIPLPTGWKVKQANVGSSGWLAAHISNVSGAIRKLAVWDPLGVAQSLPVGYENGYYNDFHFTTIFDTKTVLTGTHVPSGSGRVFVPAASGTLASIPSLEGKAISSFAGNGTAITSTDQLWRNGKLTAMGEVCARYGELRGEGYNFTPIKANKHGSYLLQAEDPQGNPKAFAAHPMQVVSRDKFLAGSFRIPESYSDLEIEFGGPEDLGRYGDLLGGGSTRIFDSVGELLSPLEGAAGQPADQKVWFVRDAADPRKINFYTCYTTLGTAEIKLHLNSGGSAQPSLVTHQLTAAPDLASIISYVDRWVKGSSFTGPLANTTWLAMNTSDIVGLLANQTRACLIPFFDIIVQVQGLTPMIMGLCDGIRTGFTDDKAFIALLINGNVTAGQWLQLQAVMEITRWQNDPETRSKELKKILHDLCQHVVLPGLSGLGEKFTTWEGFKNLAWRAWEKSAEVDRMMRVVTLVSSHLVVTAMINWGDEFCSRMLAGPEKIAWDATPWDTSPFFNQARQYRDISYYTFGYTIGYLSEQAAVALVTGGAVSISKICLKGGVSVIGKLAPRVMAVAAMRFNFIKEALTGLNLMDDGLRLAYERAMASAASEPTTPLIKEGPASLMESRMANPAFNRNSHNFQKVMQAAMKNGNIRKLVVKPGGAAIFKKRTAQLTHLLGDACDDVTMNNFLKVAEERLVVVHPDGTVDEFFEGFYRASEGNSSLMANLDDPLHSIAGYSDGAKARLKFFLSDPDAGALWKLDDYAPGDPESWKRYITRGVLAELDIYKRIYKPQGFGHSPTAPGFDFDGPKWVQIKTCKNPGATQTIADMKTAITDLVTAAGESPAPLKLHILKKPGVESDVLNAALIQYRAEQNLAGRLEILIEAYNIGPL